MSVTLRNRILFAVIVALFLAGGVLLYREWANRKPFAIILLLAENFTPSQLAAARLYAGGSGHRLGLENWPNLGLAGNPARDYAVADPAAAASALATGTHAARGALSVLPDGTPVPTLLEKARESGRVTGVVSSTSLLDAPVAAFYAHAAEGAGLEAIGAQMASTDAVDVWLGAGGRDLLPEHKEGRRTDGRDLLLEMRGRGYDIVRNKAELDNTPAWRTPKLFGIFGPDSLARAGVPSPSQPSLSDLVRRAIELLQFNRRGYVLVVYSGLPGRAAAGNQAEMLLQELDQLDAAAATARAYAGEEALIVVAGTVSVGGLRLTPAGFTADRGMAVLGPGPGGVPAATWSTGPGNPGAAPGSDLVAFPSSTALPVAEDVLVLSLGPGAESLRGFLDNTDIHRVLSRGL